MAINCGEEANRYQGDWLGINLINREDPMKGTIVQWGLILAQETAMHIFTHYQVWVPERLDSTHDMTQWSTAVGSTKVLMPQTSCHASKTTTCVNTSLAREKH